jgi:uncharacterized protein YdbL (DUF1318 family)
MNVLKTSPSFRISKAIVTFALSCLIPASAFALSLEQAKAGGMVGEEPTGYLGVVSVTAEASQLAQDINAKRRERYQQIAKENGTPVSAVEALAGKKAIENTPPGQYVKSASGSWIKK